MHITEVDLNYSQYYPLSERYISLYPPKGTDEPEQDEPEDIETQEKPPMWAEIERRMVDGTLMQLRNRHSTLAVPKASRPAKPTKAATVLKTSAQSVVSAPKTSRPQETPQRALHQRAQAADETVVGNRRMRRKALREEGSRGKTFKSFNTRTTYAPQPAVVDHDDGGSDGGFFEE